MKFHLKIGFILLTIFTVFLFLKFTTKKPSVTLTPKTTIILTGDVMLGRSVMGVSLRKNNPNYPFEKVKDKLSEADLVFINLENPIIENCPFSDEGFKFCADPKMLDGLDFAGIDIVNLANNHTKNYGESGFNETKKLLELKNISYVGDNNLTIKKIDETTFGFLGFDFVVKTPTAKDLELLKESKNKVDVLLVMVHWGTEYQSTSSKIQQSIANDLVTNGADIIVGNHPHWIQEIEDIKGKKVFYSLGNFIFDQDWSEKTKKGLAIKLTYNKNVLENVEKMPIYMTNSAQPEWSN